MTANTVFKETENKCDFYKYITLNDDKNWRSVALFQITRVRWEFTYDQRFVLDPFIDMD